MTDALESRTQQSNYPHRSVCTYTNIYEMLWKRHDSFHSGLFLLSKALLNLPFRSQKLPDIFPNVLLFTCLWSLSGVCFAHRSLFEYNPHPYHLVKSAYACCVAHRHADSGRKWAAWLQYAVTHGIPANSTMQFGPAEKANELNITSGCKDNFSNPVRIVRRGY